MFNTAKRFSLNPTLLFPLDSLNNITYLLISATHSYKIKDNFELLNDRVSSNVRERMNNFSAFGYKKDPSAHLSHFIILHIYNLNERIKRKKEREREEKDNLGKDRLSDLISSSSSRISVEYQINRNE